jgi:hypothetical protein
VSDEEAAAEDPPPSAAPWLAGPPPPPPSEPDQSPTPSPRESGQSGPGDQRGSGRPRSPLNEGSTAFKAGVRHLKGHSPWVLGAVAILVAFATSWFADLVLAFRHAPGSTSQDRVMQFFAPGSIDWGIAVLLGVCLVAGGRRFDLSSAAPGVVNDGVSLGLMLAAGAVGVSATIDLLVELTNFGHGIDAALSGLVGYAAVLPLAGVSVWWAHRLHTNAPT